MNLSRLALLLPFTLIACGPDLTSQMEGDYTGSIVAGSVVETGYTVTLTAVDNDTITVEGADFDSFDVDLIGAAEVVTSDVDDNTNTLSWRNGALSVDHADDANSVSFSGTLQE